MQIEFGRPGGEHINIKIKKKIHRLDIRAKEIGKTCSLLLSYSKDVKCFIIEGQIITLTLRVIPENNKKLQTCVILSKQSETTICRFNWQENTRMWLDAAGAVNWAGNRFVYGDVF